METNLEGTESRLYDDLFNAIEMQNIGALKRVVGLGLDINCSTDDGWTPLLEASKDGPVEIVKFLLDSNANPNIASHRGYTPLMRAAGSGQVEIVQLLLKCNADAGARDMYGQTAAAIAHVEGEYEIAELIDQYHAANLLRVHNDLVTTYNLHIVNQSIRLLIHSTRRVVGGYVYRLDIILKNGQRINQCKIIDELLLLLPLDIAAENIQSYSVPFQQEQ